MTESEESLHKKRRLQRACDFCRKKKIRCDGVQTSVAEGSKCSNCKLYNSTCTYVEAAQKRVSSARGYVETLEDRVERMDSLLTNLVGQTGQRRNSHSSPSPPSQTHSLSTASSPTSQPKTPPVLGVTSLVPAVPSAASGREAEEDDFMTLTDNFQKMDVADDSWTRFFGKSSSAQLVQTAIELKNGTDPSLLLEDDPNVCNWIPNDVCDHMRPEFKVKPPWEVALDQNNDALANYVFPEEDLFNHLIEVFFAKQNMMLPLLHRPTFDRQIAAKMHLNHQMFGGVALLVCALASRFTDDPRVLLDGETSRRSSGWKYFTQVQTVRRSLMAPPTIHDLQFYTLYSNFLFGTSAPQACWAVIGMGIRLAQDVGAHRKKKSTGPNAEDELWKRAFWSLVMIDREASLDLGRPCAIQDDDIDVDFPIECDDEYWEHPDPEKAFKQPPGKPSYVSFFVSGLKLNQIVGTCLRTLYSTNKAKLRNTDKDWEQNVVTELDSALNAWVDSVPEHLRWDPHREDEIFFNQSVALYTEYYNIQILIHKPFIPSPRNTSPLTFPSLAICTNAARSCSHIVDIQRQRGFLWGQSFSALNAFAAAIVLLLNIWGGKRSRMNLNPVKEMLDVHKCMQVLRDMENTYHFAGRLWDILFQLASVGNLPLPEFDPSATAKRRRDDDDVPTTTDQCTSQSFSTGYQAQASTSEPSPPQSYQSTSYSTDPVFNGYPMSSSTTIPNGNGLWLMPQDSDVFDIPLPMHSSDLGRMPLHPQATLPDRDVPLATSSANAAWPYSDMTQEPYAFGLSQPKDPINAVVDDATFALWANAPGGLDLDDWASYIAGVSQTD
ncbi:fungal-specific transcription factor domain-containing protein [Mucidula mucida]|nr:fungal-specific transcription factor domain-containing protein [Mucidula mucida]